MKLKGVLDFFIFLGRLRILGAMNLIALTVETIAAVIYLSWSLAKGIVFFGATAMSGVLEGLIIVGAKLANLVKTIAELTSTVAYRAVVGMSFIGAKLLSHLVPKKNNFSVERPGGFSIQGTTKKTNIDHGFSYTEIPEPMEVTPLQELRKLAASELESNPILPQNLLEVIDKFGVNLACCTELGWEHGKGVSQYFLAPFIEKEGCINIFKYALKRHIVLYAQSWSGSVKPLHYFLLDQDAISTNPLQAIVFTMVQHSKQASPSFEKLHHDCQLAELLMEKGSIVTGRTWEEAMRKGFARFWPRG